MYAICKTIHPSTHIEHSIYCHFYNYDERNLVVAGSNQLKVYRLIKETETGLRHRFEPKINLESSDFITDDNVKLECRQKFSFHSNVDSLNFVSFPGANRDCLLLGFSDAKLSVVEYDPRTHDLKTISMHFFEDEDLKSGYSFNFKSPMVRVDPENRCAAILIYSRTLLIIPFRKEVIFDDTDSSSFSTANHSSRKTPVLPSYKLDLKYDQYGVNIINILDIQFLHNYYEPTLLILYEPVRAWAGRIAVRQDTVSMITLSLNVHQKVHPHIWSINGLPFNTFAALPVSKPIGGVLILAHNAMIHLNQGLPPFGISLNGFNDSNTSFPLKTQDNVRISLDCCQSCFISNNKIMFSLNNGDLYLLTLHNDMTRSLRTFNFVHLASSVIPLSLTKCEDGYLFIGSRVGHSLLLHYLEKIELHSPDPDEKDLKQSKQTLNNIIAFPDFNEKEQTEEEYLYGSEYCLKKVKYENENSSAPESLALTNNGSELAQTDGQEKFATENGQVETENINSWSDTLLKINKSDKNQPYLLKLCDVIYNIGPCGNVCLGEPSSSLETFVNKPEFDVELVTTSGYWKNGGFSILQRTIKPQIETSFKLPDCIDAWTVYGPNYFLEEDKPGSSASHEYMVLSQKDCSIVFQVGSEINELDQSGFITQSATVFTGNLGGNKYIIQVCRDSVRLLKGTQQLQHFPVNVGSPIVHTSLADPYTVLMSESGIIIMLRLKIDPKKGLARLVISKPDLSTAKSKICTLCVYKDLSGMFTAESKHSHMLKASIKNTKQATQVLATASSALAESAVQTAEEEDELLYGDSTVYFLNQKASETNEEDDKCDIKLTTLTRSEARFYLFIVRENSVLEVYSLPDFKLVYLIKNFSFGLRVLVDSVQATESSFHTDSLPIVKEILMIGLGSQCSKPYLFVRLSEDLFVYEVFQYHDLQIDNHLKIRFKKVMNNSVFIDFPGPTSSEERMNADDKSLPKHCARLRPFANINGYSGVFLCGLYPTWFIMTSRNELRVHKMDIDGQITSFAPFNNVNCPNGFLYFNQEEELRISVLSNNFELDADWPCKNVCLKKTVHFICYNLESKTYSIIASKNVEFNQLVRVGGEEKEYEVLESDPRYIPNVTEQFHLELLSPINWDTIPDTLTKMDEWEHVTCLKYVMLTSEGTQSGVKGYICIGTNYAYGEDVTSKGRIWIFDVIEVVPEPGKPLTKNKLKLVYCKDQKGPVTTLCQVKGYLLSAIGQKIYIWQLKEAELKGVAFIDSQIYVNCAVSVRNLILVSDIHKSVSLLRYQEETRTLSLVSRDQRSLEVYACEYMIDHTQMNFIVSDSDKNIIIYTYQPDNVESMGGTRLLRRADFHIGSLINTFFRLKCNVPHKNIDPRNKHIYSNRHLTMYATLDGSIGYVLPISEKTYRRLLMLQNLLTTNMQHNAGLNPKACHLIKTNKLELMNPSKNVLDGNLLFLFLNLSFNEKTELAKKIGTTMKQVIMVIFR